MVKNTFATFGILAVLLLSLGMTTSAAVDGFDLSIDSIGTSQDRISGDNGTIYSFSVTLDHANDSLGKVYINWSGDTDFFTDITSVGDNQSNGTIVSYTFEFTLPDSGSASKILKANIYNSTNLSQNFGVSNGKGIFYNVTSTPIEDDDDDPIPSGDSWCKEDFNGEKGDLEITLVDITNNGQGDDDAWEYLDEIEIEIALENTHDDDNVDDVVIEIEIRDDRDNTYTKRDFSLNDDEEKVGRIKDGDEETITFTIDELPIDLEEGTYRLYVRAYEDGNENNQCASESDDLENNDNDETYFEFEIEASQDSAIIVKNNMDNIMASCGDNNVEVKFKVYNTGSDKEDKVLVNLYSSRLNIDEYAVIDNLRDGSGKEVSFFISVPEEMSKNSANLDILLYYDYDEDEDELDEFAYGESSDEEGSDFTIGLEIISCAPPEPTINANLESKAQVGKDLIVKAIITNNGNDNDFTISASGYESWAELVSVEPQTASINEGEFTEVLITLSPTEAGKHSFKIITLIDGTISEQTVSLTVAEKGILGFSAENSIMDYTVIGIVALLVLIFLVLMVRMSKRTPAAQF